MGVGWCDPQSFWAAALIQWFFSFYKQFCIKNRIYFQRDYVRLIKKCKLNKISWKDDTINFIIDPTYMPSIVNRISFRVIVIGTMEKNEKLSVSNNFSNKEFDFDTIRIINRLARKTRRWILALTMPLMAHNSQQHTKYYFQWARQIQPFNGTCIFCPYAKSGCHDPRPVLDATFLY